MVIFKYQLEVVDEQTVRMPYASRILCVQTQNEIPCLWAFIMDPDSEPVERIIKIVGTGNFFEGEGKHTYHGTFQLMNGGFVGHVFEEHREPH